VPIRKFLAIRSATMVDNAYLQFIRTFARICQLNEIFQTENRQEKKNLTFWILKELYAETYEEDLKKHLKKFKKTIIENFELSKDYRKTSRQIT